MKLELRNVSKSYQTRRHVVSAIETTSLSVAAGEFVCLVGPSGCGKSTILNILAGLEQPTTGTALDDGQEIRDTDPRRVLIFQDPTLFPWLTVKKNVEFGLKMKGVPRGQRSSDADALLQMVHLEHFAGVWVHQLSGGMRQRVALARALAVEPEVLLMDEPFAALDAITRGRLHGELQELWMETRKTIVFVTHNVREAVVLGDRVLVLSKRPGRLVGEHRVELPRPRSVDDAETLHLARKITAELHAK